MSKLNQQWGKEAEMIAADYLRGKGYVIVDRNFRPKPRYEIDIIARKDNLMVFVEVKARKGDKSQPLEALDSAKIRRIVIASDIFLRQQEHLFCSRYDVVTLTGTKELYEIEHLEGAFIPPLFTK